MRTFTVGGLDHQNLALRESAALPILNAFVPVQAWSMDCLEQVVSERRGVILMAPPGAGKSVAIALDAAAFTAQEEQRRERESEYEPRRVVVIGTITETDPRKFLMALYLATFGVPPTDWTYRRPKTADEIRLDFIANCKEENVVAIIVDEAQLLHTNLFDTLRAIMAASEPSDAGRVEQGSLGPVSRPKGIGVLLVGTNALQHKLHKVDEIGRRWIRTEVADLTSAEDAPKALTCLLPAFAEGASVLGMEAWAAHVTTVITHGRPISIASLVDVTRCFLRRASALQPEARAIEELRWDADLFLQAAYELIGISYYGDGTAAGLQAGTQAA